MAPKTWIRGLVALALIATIAGCENDPPTAPLPRAVGQLQISALTVENIGSSSATITWNTNQPAGASLTLYESPSNGVAARMLTELGPQTNFAFSLSGLSASKTYLVKATSSTPTATVTADLSSFTTLAPPPGPPEGPPESELVVVSFSLLEYQSGPRWWYVPRLEVRETTGKNIALVEKLGFSISDRGSAPFYDTYKCVGPLEQRRLLVEVYGDYELELSFDSVGNRTTSKVGTAVVAYRDGTGRRTSLTVSGPIIPGAPLTTFASTSPTWGC